MRIALVHRLYTRQGGVEKNVVLLAEGLAARGHSVTVIAAKAPESPAAGIVLEKVAATGWTTAAKYEAFDRAATEAIGSGRFDVVQGFDLTTRQDVLRVGRGVKRVYDGVLAKTRGPLDRLVRALSPGNRRLARLESRVFSPGSWRILVTNCEIVRQELIGAYGVDPARIEVVWNGVDAQRFTVGKARAGRDAVRRQFGFAADDRVVLHVGTVVRRMGVDTTLKAIARLGKEDARVRGLVVGRDGAMRRYRALARSLGIADRVVFTGPLPVEASVYGAADVLSLASRYEPFGNAILEALACGIPAIHPQTGGASEVLRAESLVELVTKSAEDDGELADALGRALAGGTALSARCRAAAERHGTDAMIASYESIYRRLVAT